MTHSTEIVLLDEPDYLLGHDPATGETDFAVKLGKISSAMRKRAWMAATDVINEEIERDARVFGDGPHSADRFRPLIDAAIARALST